jgi:hypothetical protein
MMATDDDNDTDKKIQRVAMGTLRRNGDARAVQVCQVTENEKLIRRSWGGGLIGNMCLEEQIEPGGSVHATLTASTEQSCCE